MISTGYIAILWTTGDQTLESHLLVQGIIHPLNDRPWNVRDTAT